MGNLFKDNCATETPSFTETVARFKYPATANILEKRCWGMQGWYAYTKFEMAPSDLQSFLDRSLVRPPLSGTGVPYDTVLLEVSKTLKSYLYGKHEEVEFQQDILIDTSNPEKYVVYLNVLGG
ncbi:MAG: hypothetical protein KF726_09240 [Anaerolineae bacterium]|nr:hypothetical protein [Anaerolineae bacterium]